MKRILGFFLLSCAVAMVTVFGISTGVFAVDFKELIADPDTSDSYIGSLLSALPDESSDIGVSTREAGRIWADKTVTPNRGGVLPRWTSICRVMGIAAMFRQMIRF